jgi:protein-tyrosine phosphatase
MKLKHPLIDVHGHLLPALDDGSRSLTESLELARRMVALGYTYFTCTPHIWPEFDQYRPDFIADRTAALQRELDANGIPLKLVPGGELNIDLPLEYMEDHEIPTYGMMRKFALFDFWHSRLPVHFWPRVDRLRRMGVTPILAHPERIKAFQMDLKLIDEVQRRGLLLQGNLQCLADPIGEPTRDLIELWLRQDRYFMLGSDLHQLEGLPARINGLSRAKEFLGEADLKKLLHDNPLKVITGST